MARRIFFFLSLAALIVFFILYCDYIDSTCEEIVSECDKCIELVKAKNFDEAGPIVDSILKKWEKEAVKFEIIISNITTDHIHLTINKVDEMLKINNLELSLEYLLETRNIFDDLPTKEHLNWGNVF